MEVKSFVNINLDHIEEGLQLAIDAKVENTLFLSSDALENGEAEYQLVEGFSYDYELNKDDFSLAKDHIVQPHSRKRYLGLISPNIYVGTLTLTVLKKDKEVGYVNVEVRSVKADYRDDYRDMLELITEKCTDLLMQANSPVTHNFETDFEKDNETLYQKFAFIKSIVATDEFAESVHRIVSSPVTKWKETSEQKDVRNIRRFKNSNIKELITGSKRTHLPDNHYLHNYGLKSLPDKITAVRKTDTVDTPENRFVKFALESFLKFVSDINKKARKESKLWLESDLLEKALESFLHHSIFKEISRPETLRLNSPVLQRKEGYREVLRVWLMFDLAAKLVWKGGDDIYKGGKKDIATLYEYWLFFKLLDLFKSVFDIEHKDISELIKETSDGLNLQLKQGNHTALRGIFNTGTRKLNIRFNYNRSFSGQKDYPHSGSWTTTMRPDYTLSFWPHGISEKDAEVQELIVHIHFDAKYKIANLTDILSKESEVDIDTEKNENRKGVYKNADLLKMHAYKDAIRRTGGAYVLYPGDTSVKKKGFHEIIPGLGAFPVRPSKTDDGINELKEFILEVIQHFVNRASQREKIAYRTYDVYRNKPQKDDEVNEALPETYGKNRSLIPGDTYVLVGFYKKDNLEWILHSGLYNARADCNRGSLRLGPGESGAKYLLLHAAGETKTGRLVKVIETGPRVFSKQTLIDKGYPSEPTQNYYLVYKIHEITEEELKNQKWDITKLEKFRQGRASALPFSVTLAELMKTIIKE
ncbi:DUF2357 domain-containing protein [Plebeiibacterium marinum]|uniref:Restriction endonuclease-like protein n=1 Tax=Plebeiibacterium marinum TaxID=2992111 RepID=A0AAE3MHI8_9BACT|nr:DUF2357 domain-containing protein [Plebeiobacterium marinum]MCW3807777.1 restriction endonuclease-like protein [Plebeiobacterium marinum]